MPQTFRKYKPHPWTFLDLEEDLGWKLFTSQSIAAGAEASYTHGMGRIPRGYVVISQDGGDIHSGDTANTTTTFYLVNRGTSDATISFYIVR